MQNPDRNDVEKLAEKYNFNEDSQMQVEAGQISTLFSKKLIFSKKVTLPGKKTFLQTLLVQKDKIERGVWKKG